MTTLWTVSALFYALWAAAGLGLLRIRGRLLRSGESLGPSKAARALSRFWFFHTIIPAVFVFGLFIGGFASSGINGWFPDGGGVRGFVRLGVPIVLPYLLLFVSFHAWIVRQESQATGIQDRRVAVAQFFDRLSMPIGIAVVSVIFLVAYSAMDSWTVISVVAVGGIVLIVAPRYIARALLRGAPGDPFPMDECPLKDEILALAAAAEWTLEGIWVQPLRAKDDNKPPSDQEKTTSTGISFQNRNRNRPILPVYWIQRLDPEALTAWMAMFLFAQKKPSEPSGSPLRRFLRWAVRGKGVWAWVALLVVARILPARIAIFVMPLVLVWLIAIILTAFRGKGAKTMEQAYRQGEQVWRERDPARRQSAEKYVEALMRFQHSLQPDIPVETVIKGIERTPGWAAYVDECLEGGKEKCAEIVRRVYAESPVESQSSAEEPAG